MEIAHGNRPGAGLVVERYEEPLLGRAALVVAGSLLVGLCAHLTVPLPFTPVPLTLSDLAVLLVGLSLGPVAGFAALTLYLAEGAVGLPVFNPAGVGGLHQLFGATGGYLLAYPFAAAIAGGLFRVFGRGRDGSALKFAGATGAAAVASALIMTLGVVWLGLVAHLPAARALLLGGLPFLPGQVVKVLAAAGIVTSIQRWHRG